MVKRNKRRKTRKVYVKSKSYHKKSSVWGATLNTVMGAGIYGAFRAKVSNYLSQFTDKIPLGNISDEVGMGLMCILAKKVVGNKIPMAKKVFDAGLVIESARVGEAVSTGSLGGFLSSSSNNTSGTYTYG